MDPMHEALEALTAGIATFDAQDRVAYVSPPLQRLLAPARLELGITQGEMLAALRAAEFYTADGLQALVGRLNAPSAVEAQVVPDEDLPLCSGDWHRVRVRQTPSGGKVMMLWNVSEEITGQVLDAAPNTLLRRLLSEAPVCLTLFDIDYERMLFQTPDSIDLFGHIDDHISKTWYDDTPRPQFVKELYETHSVDRFEAIGRRADGTPFPANLSARIVEHQGRKLYVSTTYDMTEPYAIRDALHASRQRLLDAMEALGQALVIYDAQERFLLANAPFRTMNAALADKLQEGAARADLMAAARAAGLPDTAVAWRDGVREMQLPDGREFEISRTQMSDGGTVVLWSDVTEARATARELARRREAAFQNEKLSALGELLSGVAHELNNPLSVIVGQTLMLEEDIGETDVAQRRISRISSAAERCSKIVRTFVSLAREQPARMVPTDLNQIAETAVDVAAMWPQATRQRIELDLSDALPMVDMDPDQMTHALLNLLMNAINAVSDHPAGTIRVMTHGAQDGVRLQVIDNGPGVPEAQKARIFEPFYSTREVGQGSGMGLALARQIVTSHRGGLRVLDAPDGGACFEITLPVPAAQSAADQAPSPRIAS